MWKWAFRYNTIRFARRGAAVRIHPVHTNCKLGFSNYFMFSRMSTGAEYWWWALFVTIVGFVLAVVDTLTGTMGMFGDSGLLGGFFELATLIPSFAVGAKRLHDINISGWWQLLWFVVVIGWIVLIMWATRKGDEGPNQHGPDPRQATSQQFNEPWWNSHTCTSETPSVPRRS